MASNEIRRIRIQENLCVDCGLIKEQDSKIRCNQCLRKNVIANRKYRHKIDTVNK